MPNPSPRQTEEFKKHRFKPVGEAPTDEKLERTPVAVTVGKSIYEAIHKLDRQERITWLRKLITEAARKELLNQEQGTGTGNHEPSPSPENSHFFSKPGTLQPSPRRRLRIRVRR